MRMFNSEFNEFSSTSDHSQLNLYPSEKLEEIDELFKWITRYVFLKAEIDDPINRMAKNLIV